MELKGKAVVVTGGAMGIGLATSKRLVREGCAVTIWDLNASALEDAKRELEVLRGRVFTHACDVTDKTRVYELAKTAASEMGQVDILINNAGYVMGGDFLEQRDKRRLVPGFLHALHGGLVGHLRSIVQHCGHSHTLQQLGTGKLGLFVLGVEAHRVHRGSD